MKTLLRLALILALAALPAATFTGCATPPATTRQAAEVQTLKAVGHAAEGAVLLSARLYADGKLTAVQARAVIDFYDRKFQPAFRVALAAAKADTEPSPANLTTLAAQLLSLVNP